MQMKRLSCARLSFILAVMWFIPHTCLADDEKTGVVLEEVIVTATRGEKKADEAPANVTIINRDDLDRLTFYRLDEAIRYEANVYDGKLRGLPGAGQTLVMLNGMPLNSGWYGGVRWDNIAVENVERIEIVRGPASALYGGNAMGGTINIVTRMPREFEAGLRTRLGSNDNVSYGGFVGDRFGDKLSLRLGFLRDEELYGYPTNYVQKTLRSGEGDLAGGFFMKTRTDQPAWIVGDQGDRTENQWNINLTAGYDLTDTGSVRLDSQAGRMAYDYGPPHSYIAGIDGVPVFSGRADAGNGQYASFSDSDYLTGRREMKNQAHMLTYTERFGPISFIGKLGYQHEDMWYTTPTAASGQNYYNAEGNVKEFDTDTWFADLQIGFGLGSRHYITTGLYGKYNKFDQGEFQLSYYRDADSKITGKTELTAGKDRYFAVYVQDEIVLIERLLTAYAGARFDYWEAYGGLSGDTANPMKLDDVDNHAFSPKLALVWMPLKDTTVKGSVGKAFRAPTLYDLYRTYESRAGRIVYSNPDLDPETILNYEIGIIQYFLNRMLKTSATVFYSDIENLIYTYDDDDGNSRKDNAGEARIQGIELGASVTPWHFLSIWANYTFNDTEITKQKKDPEMEGKKITGMPDQTINAGLDFMYHWFKASLTGRYAGRIYKTQYNKDIPNVYTANTKGWLWHAKLSAELPCQSDYLDKVQLSFSVENLFDKEYFDYSIGRERSYFAEIKLNW